MLPRGAGSSGHECNPISGQVLRFQDGSKDMSIRHVIASLFSRNFSQYLEKAINKESGQNTLIAHELENSYFFPIQEKKIVVAGLGSSFSWFSFVTLFITGYGVAIYIYGLLNINFSDSFYYTLVLSGITLITLTTGIWWFVLGVGEKRLKKIYEKYE